MSDEPEQIILGDFEPRSHHCPLCKRTFAQESTRKRHYYYCRSKLSETNVSRRRSCIACIHAKTRCTWVANKIQETCIRCNKRGAKCEYDTAAQQHRIASQDDLHSTSSVALHGGRDIQENTTSSILTRRSNPAENLLAITSAQSYENTVAPLGPSIDANWDAGFGEIDILGLENILVGNQDINFMSSASSKLSDMLVTATSSAVPLIRQLTSPSLFNTRAFTKPGQAPLLSLAMRILRSYPFMILQKGNLPPFMSPLISSWAETGTVPPQQCLIYCVNLVRIFKSQTTTNKNLIWRLVKLEQERISTEHSQFDRCELLAALQALLIYCLLRLQDVPVGHDVFDLALLTTANLVSSALTAAAGQPCVYGLPDDLRLAWKHWVFHESRRRTLLIFQILNILLDIPTTISCYPTRGFSILPLPSIATLWKARDAEAWTTDFIPYLEKRTIYGLSVSGELTRGQMQMGDGGTQFSIAEWEEWNAEVHDLGTLVMIVGALL